MRFPNAVLYGIMQPDGFFRLSKESNYGGHLGTNVSDKFIVIRHDDRTVVTFFLRSEDPIEITWIDGYGKAALRSPSVLLALLLGSSMLEGFRDSVEPDVAALVFSGGVV